MWWKGLWIHVRIWERQSLFYMHTVILNIVSMSVYSPLMRLRLFILLTVKRIVMLLCSRSCKLVSAT